MKIQNIKINNYNFKSNNSDKNKQVSTKARDTLTESLMLAADGALATMYIAKENLSDTAKTNKSNPLFDKIIFALIPICVILTGINIFKAIKEHIDEKKLNQNK